MVSDPGGNVQSLKCSFLPGIDQYDRDSIINDFKNGACRLMVATSVAARGLDVKQLILVVNYNCPNHYEDYVHRAGRTGRAGNKVIPRWWCCWRCVFHPFSYHHLLPFRALPILSSQKTRLATLGTSSKLWSCRALLSLLNWNNSGCRLKISRKRYEGMWRRWNNPKLCVVFTKVLSRSIRKAKECMINKYIIIFIK